MPKSSSPPYGGYRYWLQKLQQKPHLFGPTFQLGVMKIKIEILTSEDCTPHNNPQTYLYISSRALMVFILFPFMAIIKLWGVRDCVIVIRYGAMKSMEMVPVPLVLDVVQEWELRDFSISETGNRMIVVCVQARESTLK